jgi:hypothetical protein
MLSFGVYVIKLTMSELTLSKKDKHAVDLEIKIIQLMLSVKLSPKVIKTSGFHCNYQFVF